MPITILVTDRQCRVIGDPIFCWNTLDVSLRWNEVSSGQFTVPAYPWVREQFRPGNRVVVVRDGQVLIAGPYETCTRERSDDGANSGVGVLTVEFADDLASVVAQLEAPNPALTAEAQDRDYWEYSGNAEMVMRDLVNVNAGPGARAARRVPRLELGAVAGVGGAVSGKRRLAHLGEGLRQIAESGGGLGFRTRQDGDRILFEVYQSRDLSAQVRFSFGLGNIRYLSYSEQAPRSTTAWVGGEGEGADRFLIERIDTAAETAWGRREVHVPRAGSSPRAELDNDGDQQLRQDTQTARLQVSAYDSPHQKFGVHFGLGDRVSVEVDDGQVVTDVVRMVHLQAWASAGELVGVQVGTQEALSDPRWVGLMRQLDQRVSRIERR